MVELSPEEVEAGMVNEAQNQRLDALEDSVTRLTAAGMERCTQEYPHPEGLSWRGAALGYLCKCGMRYRKDGLGGLVEEVG